VRLGSRYLHDALILSGTARVGPPQSLFFQRELGSLRSMQHFYAVLSEQSAKANKVAMSRVRHSSKKLESRYERDEGAKFALELEIALASGDLEEKNQLLQFRLSGPSDHDKAASSEEVLAAAELAFDRKSAHLLQIITKQQEKMNIMAVLVKVNDEKAVSMRRAFEEAQTAMADSGGATPAAHGRPTHVNVLKKATWASMYGSPRPALWRCTRRRLLSPPAVASCCPSCCRLLL
jgi:hypothetical protein